MHFNVLLVLELILMKFVIWHHCCPHIATCKYKVIPVLNQAPHHKDVSCA